MELVLKLNDQQKEIENEFETLIRSKESDMATTSTNFIPTISTTVPSTLAASLAPTAPPNTSLSITAESTTTGT